MTDFERKPADRGQRQHGRWRRDVVEALRGRTAPRVMTNRELETIVVDARGSADRLVVARTAAALLADGHLRRVWKGLYVNLLAVPPVSPEEVAAKLRPGAVVSLQTVLGDRVANNPSAVITAIVPIRRDGALPSVGEIKTGFGVFRFHGMAEYVLEAGALEDRIDRSRPRYARATAERAFCDYLYFAQARRRSLPPPPLDLDLDELRMPVVRRLARAMGILPALDTWLSRKRAHDAAESVVGQASPALGF